MPLVALKPTQTIVDIVGALGGTWHGYNAMCRCPAHADSDPSLSIRQGHDGILVHCFAGCTAEDVLREIARIRPGRTYDPPAEQRTGRPANIERLERGVADRRNARGSLSPLSRHHHGAFDDLSYHPRCPWGPKPAPRFLPALLIAAREGRTLRSIQRIFLDLAHGGYLDKATLGTPGSATWQGMRVTDTLALGEGFETSAAFTQIHGIPCWATLGAARLDRVHIPDSVTTLIFASRTMTSRADAHDARRGPPYRPRADAEADTATLTLWRLGRRRETRSLRGKGSGVVSCTSSHRPGDPHDRPVRPCARARRPCHRCRPPAAPRDRRRREDHPSDAQRRDDPRLWRHRRRWSLDPARELRGAGACDRAGGMRSPGTTPAVDAAIGLMARLPTQTVRSEEQIDWQQFSTIDPRRSRSCSRTHARMTSYSNRAPATVSW